MTRISSLRNQLYDDDISSSLGGYGGTGTDTLNGCVWGTFQLHCLVNSWKCDFDLRARNGFGRHQHIDNVWKYDGEQIHLERIYREVAPNEIQHVRDMHEEDDWRDYEGRFRKVWESEVAEEDAGVQCYIKKAPWCWTESVWTFSLSKLLDAGSLFGCQALSLALRLWWPKQTMYLPLWSL